MRRADQYKRRLDAIEAQIRQAKQLVSAAEASTPEAARKGGNSRAYGLRRLDRERPDLHGKVLAGELSVNAAMKEAGLRPKVAKPTEAQILWVVEQMAEAWEKGESHAKLAKRLGVNRSLFQLAGGLVLWNALEEPPPGTFQLPPPAAAPQDFSALRKYVRLLQTLAAVERHIRRCGETPEALEYRGVLEKELRRGLAADWELLPEEPNTP